MESQKKKGTKETQRKKGAVESHKKKGLLETQTMGVGLTRKSMTKNSSRVEHDKETPLEGCLSTCDAGFLHRDVCQRPSRCIKIASGSGGIFFLTGWLVCQLRQTTYPLPWLDCPSRRDEPTVDETDRLSRSLDKPSKKNNFFLES